MVPSYREPIIPQNSFADKKTIYIFAAQNRTTNPKIETTMKNNSNNGQKAMNNTKKASRKMMQKANAFRQKQMPDERWQRVGNLWPEASNIGRQRRKSPAAV